MEGVGRGGKVKRMKMCYKDGTIPMRNAIVMYYKHGLMKIKIKKKNHIWGMMVWLSG